ncbi:MAG: hypothetical protein R2911_13425 [Caldilineaceae bacterium]
MNLLTEITAPIVSFVELRWFSPEDEPSLPGLDMGNGRTLSAEDVLDGHFQRLADQAVQTDADPTDTAHPKPVRKLGPAIHKLSPDLALLTDLADNLADQTVQAHPAPQFRQNLHNALEKAHQEQAAKRVLGIQSEPLTDTWRLGPWNGWTVLLVSASTIVGLFVAVKLYRRATTRAARTC